MIINSLRLREMKLRTAFPVVLTTATLALAGCSTTAEVAADPDAVTIVASTNFYADIAQTVAGGDVQVSAIITSGAQDPHDYEATAQDKLTASHADLMIENGGGYDGFMEGLAPADVHVITAVDLAPDAGDAHDEADHSGHDHDSHDHDESDEHSHEHDEADHAGHDHIAGFNEHIWYDPAIMSTLAQHIAEELSDIDPAHATGYAERATAFQSEMERLGEEIAGLKHTAEGATVFATEPVAARLLERAGLHDATPAAFSQAVEEGQDVPASTLLEARDVIHSGTVRVVIANVQAGGAEAQTIETEAAAEDIPIVEVTELLPEGTDYATWMRDTITALREALA